MNSKTLDYRTRAEANRARAIALVMPSSSGRSPRPPYEWALVILFHAALDYVRALLFERTSVEHSNHHRARRSAFAREPEADAQSPQ